LSLLVVLSSEPYGGADVAWNALRLAAKGVCGAAPRLRLQRTRQRR